MAATRIHVGVDVSKEKLDYFAPEFKTSKQVPNTPKGVRSIIARLSTFDPGFDFFREGRVGISLEIR